MNTPNATFKEHKFKMSETINGAIRLHHDRKLTDEEMATLQQLFNELNQNLVPRPGQTVKIPILCAKQNSV